MPKSKIGPLSWDELIRRLRRCGFEGPFKGGKHPYMIRGALVLTVPNPHPREISTDLVHRIIRQAGITREEWLESD